MGNGIFGYGKGNFGSIFPMDTGISGCWNALEGPNVHLTVAVLCGSDRSGAHVSC